jgi:hypothetical protein
MGQLHTKSKTVMSDDCIIQLTKYHDMLDNFPQTMEVVNIKHWFQKTIVMCKIHSNGKIDLKTEIDSDLKYINYLLEEYVKTI